MENDQGTPSAPAPATEALDVDSAASLFASILPPDWAEKGVSELQAGEPAEKPAETPTDSKPEAPKAEDEEKSEETDEEDGESEETPPEPVKYKIGDQEYTQEELEKSLLRHADYTRKTQALAEEKKTFESEKASTVAERTKFIEAAKQALRTIDEYVPKEPDWQAIKAQHPDKFAEAHAEWTLLQQERKKIADELATAEQKQMQEEMDKVQKHVEAEHARLLEVLPEFKEPATAKALMKYATEVLGFTPEQVANVSDHRLILLLHKASQFDLSQAKKSDPTPAPGAPRKPAVLTPGAEPPSNPSTVRARKVRDAAAAARKSGRLEDAARAFELSLPD